MSQYASYVTALGRLPVTAPQRWRLTSRSKSSSFSGRCSVQTATSRAASPRPAVGCRSAMVEDCDGAAVAGYHAVVTRWYTCNDSVSSWDPPGTRGTFHVPPVDILKAKHAVADSGQGHVGHLAATASIAVWKTNTYKRSVVWLSDSTQAMTIDKETSEHGGRAAKDPETGQGHGYEQAGTEEVCCQKQLFCSGTAWLTVLSRSVTTVRVWPVGVPYYTRQRSHLHMAQVLLWQLLDVSSS